VLSHHAPNGGGNGAQREKEPSFLSPIYDQLETNIPRGLMGFQDLNWPQDSQLFPKHTTVLQYIQDYGKEVEHLVQLSTQVINIEPEDTEYEGPWKVRTRDLPTNSQHEEVFDAVIVANGHFIVPYVPDIPGIKEWNKRYPGVISHAKYYRKANEFTGKKVIVVGNSASGSDISTQISQHCSLPLLWSSKSPSMLQTPTTATKREMPPIAKFHISDRAVEFADGTREQHIDAIVFATGYFYSLPFLSKLSPKLIGDGSHVQNTYQHLLYAPRPTLALLTLPQRIIPFPLSESQAAVLARLYSGRLALPSLSTMQAWEQAVVDEMGAGRNFHLLPFPKDGNYINEMSRWAFTATVKEGVENEGKGKLPPIWGEWEFWCREKFPEIRRAFAAKGEERFGVRTLEEVGFSFDKYWKEKAGDSEDKILKK